MLVNEASASNPSKPTPLLKQRAGKPQAHQTTMELMDGFEPSTSPLPRVCSTPELHEHNDTKSMMERVAGIEPASSAWKAEVLPLNYTRLPALATALHKTCRQKLVEGEGFEPSKLSRQIYSLLPLTTREPLQLAGRFYRPFQQCQAFTFNNLTLKTDNLASCPAVERAALCQRKIENASPARIFSNAAGKGTCGAPDILPARSDTVSGKQASSPP